MVLEKTLESPLDCKEIKSVHPKENLSWIFIGRTDAEAEAPVLWPPDMKNWLIGKDPDAVRGVAKSQTRLSDWTELNPENPSLQHAEPLESTNWSQARAKLDSVWDWWAIVSYLSQEFNLLGLGREKG